MTFAVSQITVGFTCLLALPLCFVRAEKSAIKSEIQAEAGSNWLLRGVMLGSTEPLMVKVHFIGACFHKRRWQ